MRRFGLALALLLLWSGLASAQDFEAAGRHFAAAQEAFEKQHFLSAAREFQAAYEITKDPLLLYNVGESWHKAGDGARAVSAYKAYVQGLPKAGDRADVEQRIREIEAKQLKLPSQTAPGDPLLAERPGQAPKAPAPAAAAPPSPPGTTGTPSPNGKPPAAEKAGAAPSGGTGPAPARETIIQPRFDQAPSPGPTASPASPAAAAPSPAPVASPEEGAPAPGLLDDHPPSRLRVAAWIGVAATVATLTAGGIFGLASQSRADEVSRRLTFVDASGQPRTFDATARDELRELEDDGKLYQGLAIGFFSAAGACAVATTVLFAVDARRAHAAKPHALRITPSIGTRYAGVSAGWRF